MGLVVFVFVLLVAVPTFIIAPLIGPVFLLGLHLPRTSLSIAILIPIGLLYDDRHSFEGISYADVSPWGILSLTQDYLPFSLIISIVGIGVAIRSILIRL